jgi:type IV pilus assembly protein PilW
VNARRPPVARFAPRHPAGFSLVELMVAMAIGVLLTLLVATVFATNSKSGKVVEASEEIQGEARLAVDALRRDVRMAGWRGCNSNAIGGGGNLVNQISSPTNYNNDLGTFLRGSRGTGSGFSPAIPGVITAAGAEDTSDVLTLRIPRAEPMPLAASMTSPTQPLTLASTAGFASGDRVIVSDCALSVAFRVTGVSPTELEHDTGFNVTDDFGRRFGRDALVTEFVTVSYFVAEEAADVPVKTLSLFRKEGNSDAEEVAGRVDSFRVTYGVDETGDGFADRFVVADDVADWVQVVSVRIGLLMKSREEQVAQTEQPFTFDGVAGTVPTDRSIRRPYNVTIQLRNRTI